MQSEWNSPIYDDVDMNEPGPVFRARGLSIWHWAYAYNGQSHGYYNTKAQAQAALARANARSSGPDGRAAKDD